MSITEELLRPLLATAAGRPLITHYDDRAGTRVELSVATLANWAAKTANWLTEEYDLEPGDPVAVLLPAHWQTAGILLGAWWCGAHITDDPNDAAVAFVPPDGAAPGAAIVAAVSLEPMGRGLTSPVAGAVDFLTDARMHGDDFRTLAPIPGTTPALLDSTVDDVLAESRERAEALGVGPASRILSTLDWTIPDGVMNCLLTILAARASLVQITNSDPTKLAVHRTAERTTMDLLAQ